MVATADIISAVDAFMKAEKLIVGANLPLEWAAGFNEHERVVYLPLEIDGEQQGSKFMVVGFPASRGLKFRLGLLFPGAICRLDYTDETHPNTVEAVAEGLPPFVSGPHYHRWALNRQFCRGLSLPAKLHNAINFSVESARSFDAILRWFCADVRIAPLPPSHTIELPVRERFL